MNRRDREKKKQDQREKQRKGKIQCVITEVGHPHLMIIQRTIHFTGKEKKNAHTHARHANRSQRYNVTSDNTNNSNAF